MVINVCEVCSVRWDPRTQDHRRGLDCVGALKAMLDDQFKLIRQLEVALKSAIETEIQKDDSLLKKVEELSILSDETKERLTKALNRITLLEHPQMKVVRSMKKGNGDAEDPNT